jgi:hypothetical protein
MSITGENMRSHFLQELWEEKHHVESGLEADYESSQEDKESIAIDIYLEMVQAVEKHKELLPLLKELQSAILTYNNRIVNFATARIRQDDKETMGSADRARRTAHNALIDNLRILSRAYVNSTKGPNTWRLRIDEGRNDRDRIRIWECNCVSFVAKEVLSKKEAQTRKEAS